MRILFDLRVVAPHWHGIARYGASLLAALARRYPRAIWTAFVRPGIDPRLPPWVRVIPLDIAPYGPLEQIALPPAIARVRPDLYVSPTYVAPLFCPVPFVMTVHDLIDINSPNPRLKHRIYFRHVLPLVARRAAAIFTVSEYSRQDLVSFGLPADRINVVPNGHDLARPPGAVSQRRLLHITNGRPHKNTPLVFSVFGRLAPRFPDLTLTVVGLSSKSATTQRIEVLPEVNPNVLATLYAESAVTLVPSFAEGFGLPALESMACGTPVVVSNRASLPEVVGEAAPALPPDDIDAWDRVVSRILTDSSYANELSARGLARAATRTWDATAQTWANCVTRVLGADSLDS